MSINEILNSISDILNEIQDSLNKISEDNKKREEARQQELDKEMLKQTNDGYQNISLPVQDEKPSPYGDWKISDRYYIWETQKDKHVRESHANNQDMICDVKNPPNGDNASDQYIKCRCHKRWLLENLQNQTLKDEKSGKEFPISSSIGEKI